MRHSAINVLLFTLLWLTSFNAPAATHEFIQSNDQITHSVTSIISHLNLSGHYDLKHIRRLTDPKSNQHTRYQLMYQNVPVFGKEVIVHEDRNGQVYSITGDIARHIENDLSRWSFFGSLTQDAIISTALRVAANTLNVASGSLIPL
ncbi:MAG: hypothetical protein AAGF06_07390, partial [Pseudomonadota bacterium]